MPSVFGGGRKTSALPLFPLRTVLFPGGLLPLKVFEQRYIGMVKACMRDSRPFGVCLITEGEEVARPGASALRFATVGTLASIVDFDMPQQGVLHLSARGETRFSVRRHATEPSGLVIGQVAAIATEPAHALPACHAPLARLLELIAARVGTGNFPMPVRYGDATWVGYRLAELLPLPLGIKQHMLEINDAGVRLSALAQYCASQGLLQAP